jgi:lipoic acid synthetase
MAEIRESKPTARRHPEWLKVKAPFGEGVHNLKKLLGGLHLNTVCQESMCPNMGECWNHGVATFMILGEICTRGCRYCAVTKGQPDALDALEPQRVAEAVGLMDLKHVVITSVDRDDLEDGGASVFSETVQRIRSQGSSCKIEVLIPDFHGSETSLRTVLEAQPDIVNHNIETVPRLFPVARGGGNYEVSLEVLREASEIAPHIVTKSGMMLGLGEAEDEVEQVLRDLVRQGVQILTLGQYLRPSKWHLPVAKHYHPEEFEQWRTRAEAIGFEHVVSGPLVRSSYMADRQFEAHQGRSDSGLVDLKQ